MATQTRPRIITKHAIVKQAMVDCLRYRQNPLSNNTGLIHRMKHIEKLCVIHGLSEQDVQTMSDEVFGGNLV